MKSAIPISIPRHVTPGQPVSAEWANQMRDCIQRLGMRNLPTSGRPPSPDTKPNLWVSDPYSTDSSTWNVTVTPGYLLYQQLMDQYDVAGNPSDGAMYYLIPKIDSKSIEEKDPIPVITLSGSVGFIYLKAPTDQYGIITEDVTVIFNPTALQSIFHERPDVTGVYYWLLAEIGPSSGSTPSPSIVRRLSGNKVYGILTNGEDGNIRFWDYDIDVDNGDVVQSYDPIFTLYIRDGLCFFTDPGGSATDYDATATVTANNGNPTP